MEKLPLTKLTNWSGWIDVIATAKYIVNSTAPGDCCYMSEDSIEAMKALSQLTALQASYMAEAVQRATEAEKILEEYKRRAAL